MMKKGERNIQSNFGEDPIRHFLINRSDPFAYASLYKDLSTHPLSRCENKNTLHTHYSGYWSLLHCKNDTYFDGKIWKVRIT